jgi:hypothetical protein
VIKKDGTKTSEKKWVPVPVCRFCEKLFQGGPNVIQAAHHGVHGTGKKKAIQLCKHTPADVKARRQQEMSITLRSIAAEKETSDSEVIQIVRQQEDHVARMENAGVELSMLVESGQLNLKLAFPRVPVSPTVASAAPTSATSSGSSSTAATRNEPSLAADSEQAAKQSAAPKPGGPGSSTAQWPGRIPSRLCDSLLVLTTSSGPKLGTLLIQLGQCGPS